LTGRIALNVKQYMNSRIVSLGINVYSGS